MLVVVIHPDLKTSNEKDIWRSIDVFRSNEMLNHTGAASEPQGCKRGRAYVV